MYLRRTFIIAGIVLMVSALCAQPMALPAAVYTTEDMKGAKLNGSTRWLESLQVEAIELESHKKAEHKSPGDLETLIIVKEGQLTLTIPGKSSNVSSGSIALIMPGEAYSLENTGSEIVVFYRMTYRPKNGLDKTRGQRNGGSLLMDWNTLVMKENERGGRRDFFNKPTAACDNFEMHVSTLLEGLPSHAPHRHDAEEIILVIKGNTTMSIDNEDYAGSAGDLFFLPSQSLHGIRNSGLGPCEYFAFQWK